MRLIDADEVLKTLESVFKEYSLSWLPDNENSGSAYAVPKAIQEIPTAYDVDKVVEEIQNLTNPLRWDDSLDFFSAIIHAYALCALNNAIDIVKRGGIDE